MNRYPRLREETERIITTYIREKESVNPSIKMEKLVIEYIPTSFANGDYFKEFSIFFVSLLYGL